jgi:hypothetical protein
MGQGGRRAMSKRIRRSGMRRNIKKEKNHKEKKEEHGRKTKDARGMG